MPQQLSTNTFTVAKWVVSADPTQGTHTTIQGAINSASSGDNIFIRGGTYTEDITLIAGINIRGARGDGVTPTVTIIGNATYAGVGNSTISEVRLQTNSNFLVTVSGANASVLHILSSDHHCTNNTGISYTNSNASSQILIESCTGNLTTTGIGYHSMSSPGQLVYRYSVLSNTGLSVTSSSNSAGVLFLYYCQFFSPLQISLTGSVTKNYSLIDTGPLNVTSLSITGTGTSAIKFGSDVSGTASAISVGVGAILSMYNGSINSSNTFAVTGGGTFRYGGVVFINSSGINVTTQIPVPLLAQEGGTGVANAAASTITLGGSLTTSGAFNSTFTMTGTTGVTFPTSGTLATTAQLPTLPLTVPNGGTGNTTFTAYSLIAAGTTATGVFQNVVGVGATGTILRSAGAAALPAWTTTTYPATNAINTLLYASAANVMSALPTVTTAVLTTASGVPTWAAELSLALGGTNAALVASNGGIFYSTASAGAILSGTATARQLLLSGASTTPAWSTSTYPTTNAINTLLYASAANVMSALATANNGVLITSTTGVPSILANGTTGQVLTATTSSPPSWASPAFVASPCYFQAYLTSATNFTGGSTATSLIFDTTISNVGAAYSTVNGFFTAPTTGYYAFTCTLTFFMLASLAANTLVILSYVGNIQSLRLQQIGIGAYTSAGGTCIVTASWGMPMTAADAIKIQPFADGTGTYQIYGAAESNTVLTTSSTFAGWRIA